MLKDHFLDVAPKIAFLKVINKVQEFLFEGKVSKKLFLAERPVPSGDIFKPYLKGRRCRSTADQIFCILTKGEDDTVSDHGFQTLIDSIKYGRKAGSTTTTMAGSPSNILTLS